MIIITIYIFMHAILFGCVCEYRIKGNVVPTYLYTSFYNLSDKIFPNDISINVSLSRLAGTLLYSIDSKGHQLIISLSDINTPTLDIEFHNKEHIYVSLPKLCGCILCKYEPILLRIQMRDTIILQCNNGDRESFKYDRTPSYNTDYPMPVFTKTDKLDAYLWLVNTPHVGNIYPNNAQLSGCIFDVWYKRERLKMGTYRTEDKCIPNCDSTICNTGTCLETYNTYPICNCTDSFNNGKFCADDVPSRNIIIKQPLQFRAVKLSWSRTPYDVLFRLTNGSTTIQLATSINELTYTLDFNYSIRIKIAGVISNKYRPDDNNILVLVFDENIFNVNFRSNSTSGTVIQIPLIHDFSRIIFYELTLQSGTGIIDMAYKNDMKEIRWSTLDFTRNAHVINPQIKNDSQLNNPPTYEFYSSSEENRPSTVNISVLSNSIEYGSATELAIHNLITKVNLSLTLLKWYLGIVVCLFLTVIIMLVVIDIPPKKLGSEHMVSKSESRNTNEDVTLLPDGHKTEKLDQMVAKSESRNTNVEEIVLLVALKSDGYPSNTYSQQNSYACDA